ncbi:hypothetical protein [Dyadobacter sp. NIV53]|nr:hypothetical protein [Dyadobacter sp. NIV53]
MLIRKEKNGHIVIHDHKKGVNYMNRIWPDCNFINAKVKIKTSD